MTDHEIQLLFIGVAVGMDLMLLVQIGFGVLYDRRDRKVGRAAQAQLDAARAWANGTSTVADLPSTVPADLREAGGVHR